jgi:hypothetical protein
MESGIPFLKRVFCTRNIKVLAHARKHSLLSVEMIIQMTLPITA